MSAAAIAITVLLVPVALLAAFALAAWIRRGPEDDLPVALLRFLNVLFMRIYHRLRTRRAPGAEGVPLEGPAIVVANHRSGLDPLAIAASTERKVRFLMAREYYEVKALRWLFRAVGAIPVNRDGSDLVATQTALQVLREGGVIGIFPQGGIRDEDDPVGGRAGVALLALRTGAPIIPAGIQGTPNRDSVVQGLLTPSRSRVVFGEPIRFERPRPSVEEAHRRILERVNRLLAEADGERR